MNGRKSAAQDVATAAPGRADGRARQRRGEIRRRAILDVAIREFAATGYEGASMRAIARKANVDFALVQHHFGDKLALWGAVLDDVLADLNADVGRALARSNSRPAAERVATYVEALVRHGADHPGFIGVMSHARLESSPDALAFQSRLRPSVDDLIGLIAKAQAEKAMIAGRPVLVFYQMVGAALRVFMTKADVTAYANLDPRTPELLDEHVRMCVRLFMPTATQAPSGAWAVPAFPPTEGDRPASDGDVEGRTTSLSAPGATSSGAYLLRSVDALMTKRIQTYVDARGVTLAQMFALIRISSDGPSSPGALAERLGQSRRVVTPVLSVLEQKGFINRRDDPRDDRGPTLQMTPRGKTFLEELWRGVEAAEAELFAGLAFEERHILIDLLRRILERQEPAGSSEPH